MPVADMRNMGTAKYQSSVTNFQKADMRGPRGTTGMGVPLLPFYSVIRRFARGLSFSREPPASAGASARRRLAAKRKPLRSGGAFAGACHHADNAAGDADAADDRRQRNGVIAV